MSSMDRVTKRVRQALHAAQDQARHLGHAAVGPEHVVLGLIQDQEGIAGAVLDVFAVELAPARAVVQTVRGQEERPATGDEVALTDSAQQVLTDARTEADTLNHHYVGTEHVLLGVLHRANDGRYILEQLGGTPEALRNSVLRVMREGPPARR